MILGATGSLGQTVCRVIERSGMRVPGLAGWRDHAGLAATVRRLRPELVGCFGPPGADLAAACSEAGARCIPGREGIEAVAGHPGADAVIVAIGGLVGLDASLAAVRSGRIPLLGCKEALVAAGELLVREARVRGRGLRPMDSEHVAAQVLIEMAGGLDRVDRLIITGSGGSVRDVAPGMRASLDVARVLTHPVWRMGPKITVDSATLINKALEVVEAGVLFGLDASRISVALDPTARIHAAIRTVDGGFLAFVAPPDMAIPVGLALGLPMHPDAVILEGHPATQAVSRLGALDPDQESVVNLGRNALTLGGTAPMALVAADEVAVEAFLAGRIPLPGVAEVVRRTLDVVGSWAGCLDPLSRPDLDRTEVRAREVASRHSISHFDFNGLD